MKEEKKSPKELPRCEKEFIAKCRERGIRIEWGWDLEKENILNYTFSKTMPNIRKEKISKCCATIGIRSMQKKKGFPPVFGWHRDWDFCHVFTILELPIYSPRKWWHYQEVVNFLEETYYLTHGKEEFKSKSNFFFKAILTAKIWFYTKMIWFKR